MGHHFLEENHPFHNHFYKRRVSDDSYNNYKMGGNVYPIGIYFVEVEIGTPSQYFQVAVDSGSTDLLVPSKDCEGCHTQNTGSFDTSATSTLEEVGCFNRSLRCGSCSTGQCEFVNSYQTCNLTDPQQVCTATGLIYSDIFGLGDLKADAIFGLIKKQTKNFQQFYQIDGVLGMSFSGSSSWGGQSPFEYLVEAGEVSNQFAMCLNQTNGGVLTLGKPDPSLYTGEFMYTPMVPQFLGNYFFYALNMTDILFNGVSIGAPYSYYEENGTGGCVLDSGTNVLLLPSNIYNPFIQTFQKQFSCPNNLPGVCDGSLFAGTCYEYTSSQVAQFPTFNVDIDGVQLVVPPQNYLPYNGTDSYQCFGVINTGVRGDLIIGDIVMSSYYVLFDRTNKQIGWADVNAKNCVGQDIKINYYYQNN